MYTIIMSHYKS